MKPNQKIPDRNSFFIAFGVYGAVGFQLVASVLIGAFLGQWIDKKLGTTPWLMLLLLCLGTAAGFYNLFRVLRWKNQGK